MNSIILDGKATAEKIKNQIRARISELSRPGKPAPTLATILVGDDPASHTYVSMKNKACASVGMNSVRIELPATTTTDRLLEEIDRLNKDPNIQGILLQHPSPPQIDERRAFDHIAIEKDVDGVTSANFGRLAMNMESYFPCTPYGMILLLREYNLNPSGLHSVVVGRSPILGKPMAAMLTNLDSTVILCHSKTKNLPELVQKADLVVGAVGKPEFIRGEWIKPGAILLDAGYNPGNLGDIDLKNGSKHSSYHTPVPGGVGPMTIATLLLQTLYSWEGKFSPVLGWKP
jgi:methylenetetrahydrofolate dehydrogenase (NADP+)/methenyltetrahydrofolate cyclohydrolase